MVLLGIEMSLVLMHPLGLQVCLCSGRLHMLDGLTNRQVAYGDAVCDRPFSVTRSEERESYEDFTQDGNLSEIQQTIESRAPLQTALMVCWKL